MPTPSTSRAARAGPRAARAGQLILLAPIAFALAAIAGPLGCKNKARPANEPEQAVGPKPVASVESVPATGPASVTDAAPPALPPRSVSPAAAPIDAAPPGNPAAPAGSPVTPPGSPATQPTGPEVAGPADATPATQGTPATQATPTPQQVPASPSSSSAGASGKPSPFPHGGVMANVTNKAFTARTASGTLGTIERLDPALDALLPADAAVEKVVEGLDWAEGPVYDKAGGRLFFSDVPQNVVYVWQEGRGPAEYLRPSGYTGSTPRGGEPGSNGLTLDNLGRLVLCQHGERCVARLEGFQPRSATETWNPVFVPLVAKYNGKRFNSPNDLCFDSRGNLYFTDPPYGLEGNANDPAKELPNQGVYRLSNKGELVLLTGEMTRPNGIALSPDERTLYVANSDPDKAVWMAYPILDETGKLGEGKVFLDVTAAAKDQAVNKGLPDGLKVDKQGNLWATGPGGVLIISPAGKHLGTLRTGEATANVAWGGPDGSTLFICADGYVARVKTNAKGW